MSTDNQNATTAHLTIMQVLPALNLGGVERGTIESAVFLKQQGHRPIVVSGGGALVAELDAHGIPHINMNVGKKSFTSLSLVKKLKKLMLKEQVDVVHVRSRLPAWLSYWAIKRIKHSNKPKFMTTLHGLHSVSRYSSIMARGDAVVAVSKTAMAYLKEHFNKYLKTEPVLIYRGVDKQFSQTHEVDSDWQQAFEKHFDSLSDIDSAANEPVAVKKVLMAGRLTRVKGFEHLLYWLKNTSLNSQLILTAEAGESNYSQQVQQLLHQHQLTNRVVWLGVERHMPDLYANVDLVVSVNNKPESFGRTVLEALSMGTPVVAFAHGGVAEILDELYPQGQVAVGDDEQLADKIDQFLTDAPQISSEHGFSNQVMFEKTLQVYQALSAGQTINGLSRND